MEDGGRFHWADYLVFSLSLLISVLVGVMYGWLDRKKSSPEEFLMAGRNMPVLPISLSMFVSWISAISFLGDPVEVYYHGAVYVIMGIGYASALPFAAYVFAPHYYRLRVTSAYQYLEMRYHSGLRIFGAISNIICSSLYLGLVLYGPSLALSQVSGLPVWTSMLTVGLVCTFYTTVGGMKAVLWADTLQAFVMFAGLVSILIQGSITLGGPTAIWKSAQEGGRINFNNFSANPFKRSTVWAYLVAGFARVLKPYTSSQLWIQRFCTARTESDMKLAVILNMPMYLVFAFMLGSIGVIMYVYFKDCDPLLRGAISKKDQLLPKLVLELLGHLPGVPGLFLSCIFSASLSTLSSGLNSNATIVLSDFAQPLYKRWKKTEMSDKKANIFAKFMSVVFGALVIGLGFLLKQTGNSHIFSLTLYTLGSVEGPLCSIFVCGVLFPFVTTLHAVIGSAITLCITVWMSMANLLNPGPSQDLPTSAACDLTDSYNHTHWEATTHWLDVTEPPQREYSLYHISPMLFTALGPVLCTVLILLTACLQNVFYRLLGQKKKAHYSVVTQEMKQSDVKEEAIFHTSV